MSEGFRIKDMPTSERPRERLVENGADVLKNSELIAILLRTGMKGVSAERKPSTISCSHRVDRWQHDRTYSAAQITRRSSSAG